jgi:hypothetical protein
MPTLRIEPRQSRHVTPQFTDGVTPFRLSRDNLLLIGFGFYGKIFMNVLL